MVERGNGDESISKLSTVQHTAESARYDVLEAELEEDWNLINMVSKGNCRLREVMAWLDNRHRRGQAHIGASLVREFVREHFPL
jgi:hypothetical protein